MTAGRRMHLWDLLVARADGRPVTVEHVGAAMISAAGVDGAAVTVMLSATPRETVYASDRVASDLEELTLTLGEGPSVDAVAGGPVLVADLDAAECQVRWPVFAPAAVSAGVRAVFALPLQVGAIRLGVMDLLPRLGPASSTASNWPTRWCWPTRPARCCLTRRRPSGRGRTGAGPSRPDRNTPRYTRPPA